MVDSADNTEISAEYISLRAALADREAYQVDQDLGLSPGIFDFATPGSFREISPHPYQMIVNHETGGRNYYEKVYGGRPVWPGDASGVTIGFGYDLGYVNAETFQNDWPSLASSQITALLPTIGKHGGNTSPDDLRSLVTSVRGVIVSWDQGEAEFKAVTVPRFSNLTTKSLQNCNALPDDCFGVLVSLTFNRGASYGIAWNPAKDPLDRYREMRGIKAAMATRDFHSIPSLIRSMERIWKGKSIETEMHKRREEEAAMFAAGLQGA